MTGKHIPTEAKKKHNELCNKLDGLITPDFFESMKRMAMTYLDPKLVEKANSINALLHQLEMKGELAVGKYDILIELMKGAGIGIGIDDINETNRDIQSIMQSSIHRQVRVKKTKEKAANAKHKRALKPSADKRKSKGKAPLKVTVVKKKSISQDPTTMRVKKTKEKAANAKHKRALKPSADKRKSKGKAPLKVTVVKKKSISQDPTTMRVKKTKEKAANAKHKRALKTSADKRKSKGKAPLKVTVVKKKSISQDPDTNMSSMKEYQSIASLTPSLRRLKIRARVIMKKEIATKRKKNSTGGYNKIKYFQFTVVDKSGEIEGVAFNDEVDKFYNVLKMGKVFYMSGATLNEANKKFNSTMHKYQLVINKDACITPCQDTRDIPRYGRFAFKSIDELKNCRPGELVDVIAIVKESGECDTVETKKRKKTAKREIQLVDQSEMQVGLTLWGHNAEQFLVSENLVIAVKRVQVSDWAGGSLTMLPNSLKFDNPKMKEARKLRHWFITEGKQMPFTRFKLR